MATTRLRTRVETVPRRALAIVGVVVFAQLLLLALYLASFQTAVSWFHLYPIIWITVSAWVWLRIRPPSGTRRQQLTATAIAVLYFLLLGFVGGLFGPGFAIGTQDTAFIAGLSVEGAAPPGYAPALIYVGPYLLLSLIPYLLVGYVTLAYLVYVTVLDTWSASAPGLLGLFACIGCSWPIIASLVAGAGGVTGSLGAAVYAHAYPLSTVAFLLAVWLLAWRPSFETLSRWLGD